MPCLLAAQLQQNRVLQLHQVLTVTLASTKLFSWMCCCTAAATSTTPACAVCSCRHRLSAHTMQLLYPVPPDHSSSSPSPQNTPCIPHPLISIMHKFLHSTSHLILELITLVTFQAIPCKKPFRLVFESVHSVPYFPLSLTPAYTHTHCLVIMSLPCPGPTVSPVWSPVTHTCRLCSLM